jgi:hypothetical protein
MVVGVDASTLWHSDAAEWALAFLKAQFRAVASALAADICGQGAAARSRLRSAQGQKARV